MAEKKGNLWLELVCALAAYVGLYYLTGYFFITAMLLSVPVTCGCPKRRLGGAFPAGCRSGDHCLLFGSYALLIGAMVFFPAPRPHDPP